MSNHTSSKSLILSSVVLLAAGTATGMEDPPLLSASRTTVEHVGWEVQDFTIPDFVGETLRVTLVGAAGGDAQINYSDTVLGGRGGETWVNLPIGPGENELQPGGTLRFIIGEQGQSDLGRETFFLNKNSAGGGGGGGSGLFYRPPGGDWAALAVSGGGGGGSIMTRRWTGPRKWPGRDARIAFCRVEYWACEDDVAAESNEWCGAGGSLWADAVFYDDFPFDGGLQGFPEGDYDEYLWGLPGIGDEPDAWGGWGCGGGGSSRGERVWPYREEKRGGCGGGYEGGQGLSGGDSGTSWWADEFYASGGFDVYDGARGHGHARYRFLVPNDGVSWATEMIDGEVYTAMIASATRTNERRICSGAPDAKDVWYSYTNTTNDLREVTIFINEGDARIVGHEAFGDFGVPNLVLCRNDNGGGSTPYVDTLFPGETVYLRVYSNSDRIALEATSTWIGPWCGIADWTAPYGALDQADTDAFLADLVECRPMTDLDGNGQWDYQDLDRFQETCCRIADWAAPYGVVNQADTDAFVADMLVYEPRADLDHNGVWDYRDLNIYRDHVAHGCR